MVRVVSGLPLLLFYTFTANSTEGWAFLPLAFSMGLNISILILNNLIIFEFDRFFFTHMCFYWQSALYLPKDTVSHLPDIKDVNINPVFPNRTGLLHVHNMAHARAFCYSYILQSRFKRPPPGKLSSLGFGNILWTRVWSFYVLKD